MKASVQVGSTTIQNQMNLHIKVSLKLIFFDNHIIRHQKISQWVYLIHTDPGGLAACLLQCEEFGIGKNQCKKACYCMESCLKEIDLEDSHLFSEELMKCSEKCRRIYLGK